MKKVSLLIVLCVTIFACSKDEITTEEAVTLENVSIKTFVYENNKYEVSFNENEEPITEGVDKKILNAIASSNVVQIDKENLIYLFDDIDVMNEFVSEKAASFGISNNQSKVTGRAGSTGYQHETFQGFPLGGTNNFSFPSLRPHGFDNLISSCLVFNNSSATYLAQYFEHENFQGRVFTAVLSPGGVRTVPDMRSVGLHDRVSSMLGRFL